MQVRWSPAAADDLEEIFDYIRLDRPNAAERVVRRIFDRALSLRPHPYQGRPGRVSGTRELSLPPLPFILVYRVADHADAVEIVNVIHGAERWPPVG
jgi:addiction module RelE/StbE family toxin